MTDKPEAPERVCYQCECEILPSLGTFGIGDTLCHEWPTQCRDALLYKVERLEQELAVARASEITLYGRSWNDASDIGRSLERRRIEERLEGLDTYGTDDGTDLVELPEALKAVRDDSSGA